MKGAFSVLNYKKLSAICLLFILVLVMFTGCGSSSEAPTPVEPQQNDTSKVIEDEGEESSLQTDSGTFSGRIDDLSIEIKISGISEEKEFRAFELSDELREKFDSYGFELGEQVLFQYEPAADGRRPIIVKIEKIENN